MFGFLFSFVFFSVSPFRVSSLINIFTQQYRFRHMVGNVGGETTYAPNVSYTARCYVILCGPSPSGVVRWLMPRPQSDLARSGRSCFPLRPQPFWYGHVAYAAASVGPGVVRQVLRWFAAAPGCSGVVRLLFGSGPRHLWRGQAVQICFDLKPSHDDVSPLRVHYYCVCQMPCGATYDTRFALTA